MEIQRATPLVFLRTPRNYVFLGSSNIMFSSNSFNSLFFFLRRLFANLKMLKNDLYLKIGHILKVFFNQSDSMSLYSILQLCWQWFERLPSFGNHNIRTQLPGGGGGRKNTQQVFLSVLTWQGYMKTLVHISANGKVQSPQALASNKWVPGLWFCS